MAKKFLQKVAADMKDKGTKGAFTAWCKSHGFPGVTPACIAMAKDVARKTGNTQLARRANFANTAQGGF